MSGNYKQLRAYAGAVAMALAVGTVVLAQPGSAAPAGGTAKVSPRDGFESAMNHSMDVMNRGMTAAPMNGNPDHDFVTMMIPHHQGAIDMARVELRYGKNPVLRQLARDIIVAQQREIVAMRRQIANSKAVAPKRGGMSGMAGMHGISLRSPARPAPTGRRMG